jgi:hypothetical protein
LLDGLNYKILLEICSGSGFFKKFADADKAQEVQLIDIIEHIDIL